MNSDRVVICGCGDIGLRAAHELLGKDSGTEVRAWVNTQLSAELCQQRGLASEILELNNALRLPEQLNGADLIYLVPPSSSGIVDQRSTHFLYAMEQQAMRPKKVVLLSTTAVYGDCAGAWVNEKTPAKPQTNRGKRRLDAERQWLKWALSNSISLMVLRVAGIYAFDRIPRARIAQGSPLVIAQECGFSNRIHADDLAKIIVAALALETKFEIFNVSDGMPTTLTEFMVEATKVAGLPPLPQISMAEAEQQLGKSLLSYLRESRQIDNKKMLKQLKVTLSHPDFRSGLRHQSLAKSLFNRSGSDHRANNNRGFDKSGLSTQA